MLWAFAHATLSNQPHGRETEIEGQVISNLEYNSNKLGFAVIYNCGENSIIES